MKTSAIKARAELARRELARRKILNFTQYTMTDYEANWHHKEYCTQIDKFIKGETKKLMVFMPPQHGKTEISTRRLPSYIVGQDPNRKIGIVAYNSTIAIKFNRDIQRIIDSDTYRLLFPDTRLDTTGKYLRNAEELEIVGNKGSIVTVGVGGGLTSRQIDCLIMDDLYKDAATAWSQAVRESVSDWYWTVAKTRLHNDSQQLLVFTRWHEDDLAGELLRKEKDWEVVMFEAIKQTNNKPYDKRNIGDALWAERHSLEQLLKIKKDNPVVFDSLYQQNPTPKEGLVIAASELKRFKREQLKDTNPDAVIAFGDIADEGEDSLCVPIGYKYGNKCYIVDVLFTQQPIEITQPQTAAMLDKYSVNRARFESNNGGKGYAQKVRELITGRTSIEWRHTAQNKHTRILMSSGQIKEHFYFLVDEEQSEMYKKYFYELTHYPLSGKVKHDDAIDGTTGLNEMVSRKQGWTIAGA